MDDDPSDEVYNDDTSEEEDPVEEEDGYEDGQVQGEEDAYHLKPKKTDFSDIDGSNSYITGYKNGYNKGYDAEDTKSYHDKGYDAGSDDGEKDLVDGKPKKTDFSDIQGPEEYKEGYIEGYNVGYPNGDDGADKADGYNDGYNDGEKDAIDGKPKQTDFSGVQGSEEYRDGYIEGYNDGYNDQNGDYNYGYKVGYNQGKQDAIEGKPKETDFNIDGTDDYKEGYKEGYNKGYDEGIGYNQGKYDAQYKMQKKIDFEGESEDYIKGYNNGFNSYISSKYSFVSVYSNIGIRSEVKKTITDNAEHNSFEMVNSSSSIGDNWRLCSILFVMEFNNGRLLADKYDFLDSVVFRNNTVPPMSLTTNSFTDNQFTLCLNNELNFRWSEYKSTFTFTVYKGEVNVYCSFSINASKTKTTYNNETNDNNDFNYNHDVQNVPLKSMNVYCKWDKPDDASYFPLSYSPNFLRVQTDHSLIDSIKYTYIKDDAKYTGIINLGNNGMRKYTYYYEIDTWKENGSDKDITNKILRIYSNRDRISFLIGDRPTDDNDENSDDNVFNHDLFTLRCIKGKYGWTWLCLFGEENDNSTLTGIWIKFNGKTVITGGDVAELGENDFMFGNGKVTDTNRGTVYGNGDVETNYTYFSVPRKYAIVYGNGNVTNNKNNGFVYGNGNVTTNNYSVYGNGNVGTNEGTVWGNGNVTTNNSDGRVYGNGNVNTNNGYVYGNGNVNTNNDGHVYGNGKVGSVDNENLGDYHGNGNSWKLSDETINGEIIKTDNTDQEINGNKITGDINTINCSVIYASNKKVIGNAITGDYNRINGFRVYGKNNTIEGNTITGNNSRINPNYIDSTATGTIVEKSKVYGNYNVINDPNTIVVKGTMNIFN